MIIKSAIPSVRRAITLAGATNANGCSRDSRISVMEPRPYCWEGRGCGLAKVKSSAVDRGTGGSCAVMVAVISGGKPREDGSV